MTFIVFQMITLNSLPTWLDIARSNQPPWLHGIRGRSILFQLLVSPACFNLMEETLHRYVYQSYSFLFYRRSIVIHKNIGSVHIRLCKRPLSTEVVGIRILLNLGCHCSRDLIRITPVHHQHKNSRLITAKKYDLIAKKIFLFRL